MIRPNSFRLTLVVVVASALVGAIVGAVIGLGLDGHKKTTPSAASLPELTPVASHTAGSSSEEIYRRDAAGVVVITSTQTERVPATFFTPPEKAQVSALGSGFVIDKHGDIVTNDHVVQGGTHIRVGFSNGATYPATIVGADASSDVAVVRVNAPTSALHPLRFANSSDVQVGEPAYAIGNPFGLDRTMTAGIVSATGRDIQAPNGLTIGNAIQTDAPINHGNSGGPLLDSTGGVVGINDQIVGGTVNANVGIGFAVPSNTARTVAAELIAHGHAEHAWLGVEADTIPALTNVRGLPSRGVVIVRVIKDGPAARAGLKGATRVVTVGGLSIPTGGDAVVALDGQSISTSEQLADAIAARRPGERVRLTVVRGAKRRTLGVTLGNAPSRTP